MVKKKFEWTGRQLSALKSAWKKWDKVYKKDATERGVIDCACCIKYRLSSNKEKWCRSCPIMIYTGRNSCAGTPYAEWDRMFRGIFGPKKADTPMRKYVAKQERDFISKVIKAGS